MIVFVFGCSDFNSAFVDQCANIGSDCTYRLLKFKKYENVVSVLYKLNDAIGSC